MFLSKTLVVLIVIYLKTAVSSENQTSQLSRKNMDKDAFIEHLEREFKGYDGRPMPPELSSMIANHTKGNDDLEDCMKEFGECMIMNKMYSFCGLSEETDNFRLFTSICEYEYTNCREGETVWRLVANEHCDHLKKPEDKELTDILVPDLKQEEVKALEMEENSVKVAEEKTNLDKIVGEKKPSDKMEDKNEKTPEVMDRVKVDDKVSPQNSTSEVVKPGNGALHQQVANPGIRTLSKHGLSNIILSPIAFHVTARNLPAKTESLHIPPLNKPPMTLKQLNVTEASTVLLTTSAPVKLSTPEIVAPNSTIPKDSKKSEEDQEINEKQKLISNKIKVNQLIKKSNLH